MKYILHICDRDKIWIVCQYSKKRKCYLTIAECFTEEASTILLKELIKKHGNKL